MEPIDINPLIEQRAQLEAAVQSKEDLLHVFEAAQRSLNDSGKIPRTLAQAINAVSHLKDPSRKLTGRTLGKAKTEVSEKIAEVKNELSGLHFELATVKRHITDLTLSKDVAPHVQAAGREALMRAQTERAQAEQLSRVRQAQAARWRQQPQQAAPTAAPPVSRKRAGSDAAELERNAKAEGLQERPPVQGQEQEQGQEQGQEQEQELLRRQQELQRLERAEASPPPPPLPEQREEVIRTQQERFYSLGARATRGIRTIQNVAARAMRFVAEHRPTTYAVTSASVLAASVLSDFARFPSMPTYWHTAGAILYLLPRTLPYAFGMAAAIEGSAYITRQRTPQ